MRFMRSVQSVLCAFWVVVTGGLVACDSAVPACNPALDTNACVKAPDCSGQRRDCKNGGLDGCETDVSSDINHCGACGNKCPTPATGMAVCTDGVCGVGTCGARYKDCNGDPSDGCETDSYRNVDNCGSCGTKCSAGSNAAAACSQGQCKLACQGAYLDCDGKADNGCETNGANDIQNCGTCGNQCPSVATANAVCAAGTCSVSSCSAPFLTCQGGAVTSCETNSSNDLKNCGTCGKTCGAVDNGTPACKSSNCAIGSCDVGYADCNNDVSDGCETGTTANPAHCGSCDACPGYGLATSDTSCQSSTCGLTCRAEYYDVNRDPSDGCELADDLPPGHVQGNAAGNRGSKPCEDGASNDTLVGRMYSDSRVHTNPDITGFVPSTGAAPDYWQVQGTGGAFCVNDVAFTFTTMGGGNSACYYFQVDTDKDSQAVILTGAQSGSLAFGDLISPAYSSGSTIVISVQKICSTATQEGVTYFITYHL